MKTDLSKILSVGGKPGIYKMLTSNQATLIVESLVDGKRMPVHSTQKISTLSDISMFTTDEDVPLRSVMEKMKLHYSGNAIEVNDNLKWLREEVNKFFPEYDAERVYHRDLKKLFSWYNILQSKGMLDFEDTQEDSSKAEKEKPDGLKAEVEN